jgi:hypothetical protein
MVKVGRIALGSVFVATLASGLALSKCESDNDKSRDLINYDNIIIPQNKSPEPNKDGLVKGERHTLEEILGKTSLSDKTPSQGYIRGLNEALLDIVQRIPSMYSSIEERNGEHAGSIESDDQELIIRYHVDSELLTLDMHGDSDYFIRLRYPKKEGQDPHLFDISVLEYQGFLDENPFIFQGTNPKDIVQTINLYETSNRENYIGTRDDGERKTSFKTNRESLTGYLLIKDLIEKQIKN